MASSCCSPQFRVSLRKVLFLYLSLFLFSSILVCAFSESQYQREGFLGRRRLLLKAKEGERETRTNPLKKETTGNLSTKNQTRLIKVKPATNNSTKSNPKTQQKKIGLTSSSTKTQLKNKLNSPSKPSNSTKAQLKNKLNSSSKPSNSTKTQLKNKLNSPSKPSNSTKTQLKKPNPTTPNNKKAPDSPKSGSNKNKTTKSTQSKQTQTKNPKSKNPDKIPQTTEKKKPEQEKIQKPSEPNWLDGDEEDDFMADFRDLPYRFQQTLLPDLETISRTSKAYLNRANKEMIKGFKPIVGNTYAPTIASMICFAFILIPLLLVSLLVNRIKTYFSLQKILMFVQAYLAIYFSILCAASVITGLEPLRFFYATSRPTYLCVQVGQILCYAIYLLLLLMYLILVSSPDSGPGSKLLALGQALVGFAVGLHYYVAVFHRAVLDQPPRTNWRVHGIYATCFLVICFLARADRRKKAYVEEGGDEGKKN